MVFLRLLFQVALGVVGFFPSLCSAAQQLFEPQDQGPPWDGLGAAGLENSTSSAAARAEGSPAAAAAAVRHHSLSEGGVDERGPSGSAAEASVALKLTRQRHHHQQHHNEQQQQQQHTEQQRDCRHAAPGTEARRLQRSGDEDTPPGDAAMFHSPERIIALSLHPDAETGNEMISGDGSEAEKQTGGGDEGLSFLSSLTRGLNAAVAETSLDSFSAMFKAHPALAELFLNHPLRSHLPESPRQKRAVEVHSGRLTSAALTMCGRRDQDEDTLVVDARPADSPLIIKALFDGHGGQSTSRFCSSRIHTFLRGMKTATPEAIRQAFLAMDAALLQGRQTQQSGSTGVVALIEELEEEREFLVSGREVLLSPTSTPLSHKLDPEDRVGAYPGAPKNVRLGGPNNRAFLVTIANVGDSRATLFHADGSFSVLSRDHKPTDPEELERIERAGGYVTYSPMSVPRVDGILALSRAFGDGFFKSNKELGPQEQRVVAVPDVHSFYAQPGDVLMLACDGAYEPDNMNWVFVSHFMLTLIHELKNDLTEAGVKLLEHAYHSLSGDNISVLLTRFEAEERERKARRFQVTPDGHIVPENPSEDLGLHAEADLDSLKGTMIPTSENPITL